MKDTINYNEWLLLKKGLTQNEIIKKLNREGVNEEDKRLILGYFKMEYDIYIET